MDINYQTRILYEHPTLALAFEGTGGRDDFATAHCWWCGYASQLRLQCDGLISASLIFGSLRRFSRRIQGVRTLFWKIPKRRMTFHALLGLDSRSGKAIFDWRRSGQKSPKRDRDPIAFPSRTTKVAKISTLGAASEPEPQPEPQLEDRILYITFLSSIASRTRLLQQGVPPSSTPSLAKQWQKQPSITWYAKYWAMSYHR